MAGILVEYARFVEVRQRRARVVEELIHPPPQTPATPSGLASADDHAIEIAVSLVDASTTRAPIDVG